MSVRSIANAAFAGLALAVVSLGNAPAKADVIDTFNATGTFATGSVLSGSLTIDLTTPAHLVVSAPDSLTFNFTSAIGTSATTPSFSAIFLEEDASRALPILNLFLPATFVFTPSGVDLLGYMGGPLCSVSAPCSGFPSSIQFGTSFDDLETGSLTLVSAPEPASIMLLAVGIAAMGLVLRRVPTS
jgi:hypothetical protein